MNSINREAYDGLFLTVHQVMYMSAGRRLVHTSAHTLSGVPRRRPTHRPKHGPKQVSEPVVRIEFPETWLWAHTEIGYLDMRLSFDWLSALLIIIDASHDCMFRLTLASFWDVLIS